MNKMKNKKGQVTIFIIIAVIVVALVAGFFIFKDSIVKDKVPSYMGPVYTSFLSCVEEDVLVGVDILESQAGYITLPDFELGSAYSPFSSQLNFLGNPIPYWYYVSGNNIQKQQVPSKRNMEKELESFIEEEILNCALEDYYAQGYEINFGEPKAKIEINEKDIQINLEMNLNINKGEDLILVKNHDLTVDSNLGKLYDSALKVYEQEQKSLFLEEYGVDVLRLYAPVDGVEISCSPEVWNIEEVFDGLQEAIEINTLALRNSNKKDYFGINLGVNEDVRFINSRNWANSLEVNPSEGGFLIANPAGNQAGLGILGFCYVTYHFIYNVKYPVLVQVYEGDEIFQFPIGVVISGNMPREALEGSAVGIEDTGLCENKNTEMKVGVYDSDLNRIKADVSYECFGSTCHIGETFLNKDLEEEFPQCINGYVVAKAQGFEDEKQIYSVIDSGRIDLVMNKIYELEINLKLDSENYNKEAVISFISDENSKSIVYPEQKRVELSEGDYEIQVYIYEESSLNLGESSYEQCLEVPRTGIGGILGLSQERCFEVETPEQIISNALSGGGNENYYISEYELQNYNVLEINAGSLEKPDSLEQLQENYLLFETKGLDILFK